MNFLKLFLNRKSVHAPDNFSLWIQALNFAQKAHEGQTIPGSDTPYIAHPMAVAAILKPCINPQNIGLLIPVALLHDTIEDTKTTYADILSIFGEAVANGVMALSKQPSLAKELRMADSLQRIQAQPRAVWMVKLADRIVNMQKPPHFWKEKKILAYKEEAKFILQELRPADEYLARILEDKIRGYPHG